MLRSNRRWILGGISLLAVTIVFGIRTAMAPRGAQINVVAAPQTQSDTPIPSTELEAFRNDAPFPRTYMFYHRGFSCVSATDKTTLLEQRGRYANVFETHMQYGANDPPPPVSDWTSYQPWRVPTSGNTCTNNDPKMVEWLESRSAALSKNRWNLKVPHWQVAFISTWNYVATPVGGFRDHHRTFIESCDAVVGQSWALHATNAARTIPVWGEYKGVNVLATPTPLADIVCRTATTHGGPTQEWRYIDWLPVWLHERIGAVRAWDGVRIDSPGNIHSYWSPREVDQDLDGCQDNAQDGAPVLTRPCPTREIPAGRKYLNSIYRDGNQYIFQKFHQYHSGWFIGGNDAWMPTDRNANYMPGFAQKPDINFTIAENWTDKWGDLQEGQPTFNFSGWANPDTGSFSPINFAEAVKIWDQWSNHGNGMKVYVILSKCAYNDPSSSNWTCSNLSQMLREFRFSLAAAAILGAYHGFIGVTNRLVPYWFDEYAVYPNNEAADTEAEKALGIGWLGMPASEAMAIDPTNHLPEDTLTAALARDDWETYINNRAWIRYFDHGVVVLNPTSSAKTVHLQGSFQRIRCSNVSPEVSDCSVNNGAFVGSSLEVPAYDGLLLLKTEPLQTYSLVNPSDDVEHYEFEAWLPDENGRWGYQWRHFDKVDGQIIRVTAAIHQVWSATLHFRNVPLSRGTPITDAFLEFYIDGEDAPRVSISSPTVVGVSTRWQVMQVGQGWVLSANVKDLLQSQVNAQNWNGTATFYLAHRGLYEGIAFRSRDYGSIYAPRLRYRVPSGGPPPPSLSTATYQHGVNGYWGGEDTHIVTTSWEPPTPHDTFPILYVRVNNTDGEVKSSLIRFNGIRLPSDAQIVKAELALFYSGQSVNGGDVYVYLARPQRPWVAPQTTWTTYRVAHEWQATGVRGLEDRQPHVSVRKVKSSEVGTWLYFDVTPLAQQGIYEYILYGSYAGVNKDIQFPANEYWDVGKRPKLVIWYR